MVYLHMLDVQTAREWKSSNLDIAMPFTTMAGIFLLAGHLLLTRGGRGQIPLCELIFRVETWK